MGASCSWSSLCCSCHHGVPILLNLGHRHSFRGTALVSPLAYAWQMNLSLTTRQPMDMMETTVSHKLNSFSNSLSCNTKKQQPSSVYPTLLSYTSGENSPACILHSRDLGQNFRDDDGSLSMLQNIILRGIIKRPICAFTTAPYQAVTAAVPSQALAESTSAYICL